MTRILVFVLVVLNMTMLWALRDIFLTLKAVLVVLSGGCL